ncbi:MAG TPA: hypothetical protein VII06_12870 [Chloroflexota bacterium]
MDLTDPALWIAIALGVGLIALIFHFLVPKPPRCPDCHARLVLEQELIDAENPERRYIEGDRRGYFLCPECGKRVLRRF